MARYIVYTFKGDFLGEFDSMQSVGNFIYALPHDMIQEIYAQDITPCYYPYHTYHLNPYGMLVGTMHETLRKAESANKENKCT